MSSYPFSSSNESPNDRFRYTSPPSGFALAGRILGIIAIIMNALLLLLPIGLILGILSLVFSSYAYKRSGTGLGGLLAAGVSFFIALLWLISLTVPFLVDPTISPF
ncbi:hypothetical protein [Paenibacillus thalictri]|uniref:DUF4190 domain-containing protein n=1 Tax=Paenibacillus thalictri TaxID=2527873 RepID=A0A4Q9DK38_9BACL|nr:hypothetical protein [Paenibacillus thalictri]TBL75094.1 hypothetical protein EYB31_24090 [Paenibacillus thalictri]